MGSVKGVNVERPNIKLDNISVNTNNEIINSDILNTQYNEFQTVEKTDFDVNGNQMELMGILEDIADFLGIGYPRLQQGYNLLQANDIDCTIDDIKSVEPTNTGITITMNNGDVFKFTLIDTSFIVFENFKLTSIKLADGTEITCCNKDDLSEEDYSDLVNKSALKIDGDIRGYSTIKVNGQDVKVYWVKDNTSLDTYKEELDNIKTAIKHYPSNVIRFLMSKNPDLFFLIGEISSSTFDDEHAEGVLGCIGGYNDSIYINGAANDDGHDVDTVESLIGRLFYFYYKANQGLDPIWDTDYELYDLYLKYVDSISAIDNGTGVNITIDFFAKIMNLYIEYNSDLKSLFPEVYDYVEKVIKSV